MPAVLSRSGHFRFGTPSRFRDNPSAVVSRRWKDADLVGRLAAELVERALNFSL